MSTNNSMSTGKKPIHHFLARQIRIRPRLFLSILAGVLVGLILPHEWVSQQITRLLIGWNTSTCLYLLLSGVMMARATRDQIQHRAQMEDEGQILILVLVTVAAVASLAAIVVELAAVKNMQSAVKYAHIGLAIFTIVSSWAFTHTMFALHYAHDYFANSANGRPVGLEFPGKDTPEYGDFLYFSFVIGTSGQTADVNLTTNIMRRIGLLHCVLAFLFNTTVLALTINIAATLI